MGFGGGEALDREVDAIGGALGDEEAQGFAGFVLSFEFRFFRLGVLTC